jgi:nucleoid-associated protein YgaU
MTTIKLSLATLIFITLVSSANANQSREEKIQALKQESNQKEDIIKIKSAQFITDLREKYPQFSDEHLDAMRLTFEESLLDNTDYSPKKKDSKQAEAISSLKPKKILSKHKLQEKVGQLVSKNAEEEQSHAYKEVIEEAKITVISLTVKKGDTLGDIAQRTYGDSSMYIAIYEENKDQLNSPNKVPEGIILRVPKVDNSMQSKFAKLVKEKKKDTEKSEVKLAEIDSSKKSPEELQRLIAEAVSDSSQ